MEGNTHLLQLVRTMRSQINKLERENRALRGELQVCEQRTVLQERDAARGDSSMTVRRYCTAWPAPARCSARARRATKSPPGNGPVAAPGSAQSPGPWPMAQLTPGQGKGLGETPDSSLSYSHPSKMKLFQEHVCKCRGKVKAVSFLLPMDTSAYAEMHSSLQSPRNQSTKQATTIAEKDM
ncbi:putative coiled-coil domain-containing protein 195 [Colius striatus]|uniref:putative coiled-coil domain-containing protein 195 n=1 Tax=Colius striatus TaxID=57412 RepID=UPI002B1E22B3|nr:putative coiled-coil domain-containing protein 195 [Colius striatus]